MAPRPVSIHTLVLGSLAILFISTASAISIPNAPLNTSGQFSVSVRIRPLLLVSTSTSGLRSSFLFVWGGIYCVGPSSCVDCKHVNYEATYEEIALMFG